MLLSLLYGQVLWGREGAEGAASAALGQAGDLAAGHMALLVLDWILLVFLTQVSWLVKLQAGAAMAALAGGLVLIRKSPASLLA